jgi:hypothetical protein
MDYLYLSLQHCGICRWTLYFKQFQIMGRPWFIWIGLKSVCKTESIVKKYAINKLVGLCQNLDSGWCSKIESFETRLHTLYHRLTKTRSFPKTISASLGSRGKWGEMEEGGCVHFPTEIPDYARRHSETKLEGSQSLIPGNMGTKWANSPLGKNVL